MSKHYLLPPDICLTFAGDDYLARQAIEFMFDYCRPLNGPEKPYDSQVTARIAINNEYLSSPLPGWIDQQIAGRHEFNHVHAFYGPAGEAAALLSNRDGFVCGLLNATGDQIDITLGKMDSSDRTLMMSPSAIFTPLVQEALQRRNHLIFHSAGLKLPDGTGIMVLADSGGGKTTTALSLLRKNAVMLADDLVIYTGAKSVPTIHGIPEPVNLTAATREFFPELQAVKSLPRDGVTDKVVFDPRDVYGKDCFGASAELHVIYFVEVRPGRPSLARIPPQAALGRMIKGCTFAFNQRLSQSSGASLFDLVSKTPCYALHTGNDPDYLGTWLQEQSAAIASGISR